MVQRQPVSNFDNDGGDPFVLWESFFRGLFKACRYLFGEADFVGDSAHENGVPGRKDLCLGGHSYDNGPGMWGGDGGKNF